MNECRCPFPTLNGHAAHCAIGQEELRKILPSDNGLNHTGKYLYAFSREKLGLDSFREQYNAQYQPQENALFDIEDFKVFNNYALSEQQIKKLRDSFIAHITKEQNRLIATPLPTIGLETDFIIVQEYNPPPLNERHEQICTCQQLFVKGHEATCHLYKS